MPSVELLQWAEATVRGRPAGGEEAVFARWFDAQGTVSETHTFASLWTEAGRIAHELRHSWGLAKGDRAVLCYGFGLDFFAAFLGCLRAGVLAVPVYPPSPLTLSKSLAKLQSVVDACDPKAILISGDVNRLRLASKLNFTSSTRRMWPDLPYKVARSSGVSGGDGGSSSAAGGFSSWFGRAGGGLVESFDEESLLEDDVAFLQFTSGSTSEPKGVMVTFANLAHNTHFISRMTEESFSSRGFATEAEGGERIRGFSWLPQYHDLGLVMCTLAPFLSGWRMGYISPLDFVRRPLLWIRLLSSERAMFGCVPDFSLRLCVRKWNEATPEVRSSMTEAVDLSALNWIQNGAEPIRASSIRDFATAFEPLGLSPSYAGTAYGMAEHVVGVCEHEANLEGRPLSELSDSDLECVGEVSRLSEGSQLKIVDPETRREVPSGEVGEIWLSSPSVAAGYWRLPQLTEESFSARLVGGGGSGVTGPFFLRTGDLARLDSGGRIYIAGRIKDLIIVRGRNLYPQDVEFAVQEASEIVRPGCVAAFSTHELGGELEVVLEVRKSAEDNAVALYEGLEAVRRAVVSEGCYPSRIVAIKERTIPKTTSGKIQRRRSRELLHQGALAVVTELAAPAEARDPSPATAASPSEAVSPVRVPSESESESSSSLSSSLSSWVSASVPSPPTTATAAAAAPSADGTSEDGDGTVTAAPPASTAGAVAASSAEAEEGREQEPRVDGVESDEPAAAAAAAAAAAVGKEGAGNVSPSPVNGRGSLLSRQKKERLDELTALVVGTAGDVLGGQGISPDQPLFDAGFDSLTAEEFVARLQERLVSEGWVLGGVREAEGIVSSTTVFDCPTARHIALHVEGVLSEAGDGSTAAATVRPTAAGPASATETGDLDGEGGDALAVVGVSCRFPGGCDSPEAFWDFLRKGTDATSGVPSDRWSTAAGDVKSGGRVIDEDVREGDGSGNGQTRGAFLSEGEAWAFDGSFFGVPPAEARSMDPQQRIMLEVGYEALHRAGFTLDSLKGSDTAVFVGACGTDWATLLAEGTVGGPPRGPYTSTGAAASMLANRLSFTLGTVGPSMTVDTACSSSLVALRQACLHLRGGGGGAVERGRVALVGGVNLLLSAGPFDLFSKTGMLAPDGRSKAFSADADGYGRGEGCGAVVLKRLEDATNDGDRVLAVIKGSAVAHNGRSATLTAPNGTSQRATIAAALREASVSPAEVSYVEAHGTGTALGDPVEFGALKAVYGADRATENPLVIGAVKSNIGHLEGAAGMSGLIKTILVLAHGAAPPNLHASDVNPRINLASLPAVLPGAGEPTRLSREKKQQQQQQGNLGDTEGSAGDFLSPTPPLLGAVSSFGFGGTNAHVVLEGKPGAFGCGGGGDGGVTEGTPEAVRGVAFLFTGQGSQYPGMGRELYEGYSEFRAVVDACDEELAGLLPRRLLSVLYGDEKDAAKLLATTRYAQPALFAVECGTAAALRAAGVVPSAVMGHSLGELAAACAAGVMSLAEGVRLVAERGRLMEDASAATATGGADGPECMAAVRSTEAETSAAVARLGDGRVSVAAVNGPDSVVLSGPRRLVELVAAAALSPSSSSAPSPGSSPSSLPASAGEAELPIPAAASGRENGGKTCDRLAENGLSALGSAAANGKAGGGGSLATGVNSSGFSTRHMSWLAGAKDPVTGGEGCVTIRDGSESTGSVSPSSDSEEGRNNRSDSSVSTDGALSDGALSDGPLSGVDGVVEGFDSSTSCGNNGGGGGGGGSSAVVAEGSNGHLAPTNNGDLKANGGHNHDHGSLQAPQTPANGASSFAATTSGGNGSSDSSNVTVTAAVATAGSHPPTGGGLDLPPDRFRILQGVSRAFHSPAMALAASGTEAAARKVSLREPAVPLASNVTGRLAEEGELTDPAYWGRHVLGTVRFHDGLTALTSGAAAPRLPEPITTFVEVGPSALLCGMGRRALRDGSGSGGGGGGGVRRVDPAASSLRWIAAMSSEERVAGKSGLGHVVGAVRGVHYTRKSYPWNDTGVRSSYPWNSTGQVRSPTGKKAAPTACGGGQGRPPLRVLETKWISVEVLSQPSSSPSGSRADGGSVESVRGSGSSSSCSSSNSELGDSAAAGTTQRPVVDNDDDDDDDSQPLLRSEEDGEEESVWLLAGRTDASYAALSDVVSDTGAGGDSGAGRGGGLAHLLTLGPTAASGETAAISRLTRLLRGGAGPELNHVVYFVGGPEIEVAGVSSKEAAIRDSAAEMGSFLAFAEAFAGAAAASPCRSLPEAVVVTRGVHACVESDMAEGWSMSWLPATLRSLALQYPHVDMRHVDLPATASAAEASESARHLATLLLMQGHRHGGRHLGEPEVCLREGRLFAPRLEAGRAVAVRPPGKACQLAGQVSCEGSYVVTGGTGGIGLDLALRFAKAGAGGLVLLSRRGKEFLEGLKADSTRGRAWKALSAIPTTKVVVLRCDVTVGDDVSNALAAAASAEAGLPPVRGIVHAACPPQVGEGGDEREGEEASRIVEQRFLGAKVAGALNLSESALSMGLELDFLVFFSSASAVLGLAGEPGYAAANGCLDGLAWHMHLQRSRSAGRAVKAVKVVSVQYGPWVQAGTAVDRAGAVEALSTLGHLGVTNDEGFSALGALIGDIGMGSSASSAGATCSPVAAIMPMHWERYASILPAGVPPLLASLMSADALGGGRGEAGVAPVQTRAETVEVLLEAARQVTGWDGELGESDSLKEQVGMDSLQAVEFRRIICTQLGRQSIPTTLAYDCPTAGKMADELLRTAPPPPPQAAAASLPSSKRHHRPRISDTVAPSRFSKASAPEEAAAAAAAVSCTPPREGPAKNGGSGGVVVGKIAAGGVGGDADGGSGAWEEEIHLDNAGYLLYRLARAFVAYLYMACVVMLPAWVFFWGVQQAAPLGGPCLLIFATLPVAWLVFGLCLCLLVAGSKWALVGRVRPGESFNTHSVRHLLWWTIQRLQSFSGLIFVDEIRRGRLVVWYYRLLGARLGRDVFLNTVRISDPDLVTVGDGSTINEHADLSGHQIIGNRVVFGSGVNIGKGTVLLPSAYMSPEAQVGDGRVVGALATASHPTRRNSTPLAPPTPFVGVLLQVVADLASLYFVAITVGVAAFAGFRSFSFMMEAANIFPGERMSALGYGPLSDSNMAFACYAAVFLLSRLYLPVLLVFAGADASLAYSFLTDTVLGDVGLPRVLAVAAISAVVFHVTHMAFSAVLKWALVQRISEVDGVCCTTSWFGFRKQITDRLIMSAMMRSVLMFNGNLGNSLWLMALGGPVGRCVSVMLNKNIYTEPELLTLGDDMHVGFASSTYCSIYTAPNSFTLRKTFIGDRGLNGAGSVTLPGATLPHGAALGPNTRLGPADRVREGALHLGSPAPVVTGRYESPPRELSRLERVLYLAAPIPLAAMSTSITLSAAFWPLLTLARAAEAVGGAGPACLFAPLAWLGLGLSLAVTGAVGKWAIIGKQHPSDTKLWSLYHYRTLLVLYLQIHAHFLFVDILRRGKMFNCYARLLGASVGRDADVATMYFTDHDLVSIGDRAVVQEDCIPHPQFYFEGTMTFKPVSVGAGGNAGARSILLGGGTVKPGGRLATLGLAAKARGMRGGEGRVAPATAGRGENVK